MRARGGKVPSRGAAGCSLHTDLHEGRDVDGIGGGTAGREGSLGLGQIAQRVVGAALQQVHLHQQQLVVQLLHLRAT